MLEARDVLDAQVYNLVFSARERWWEAMCANPLSNSASLAGGTNIYS